MAAPVKHISATSKPNFNKTSKKRKREQPTDNNEKPTKHTKQDAYTVAEFKFQLRDSTSTFTGNPQFSLTCLTFSMANRINYV